MCEYYQNRLYSHYTMFRMAYHNRTVITLGLEPTGHRHDHCSCALKPRLSCMIKESVHKVRFLGSVCLKKAAKHHSILYYSSLMLLFTPCVHFKLLYHTLGCWSRSIPPLSCSVKLNQASETNRNGGFLFPPEFSFLCTVLLSVCFLTFTKNTTVFLLNPNLF